MRQYLKYPHWYCAVALDQAVSLEAFIDPPVYCRTWYTPKVDLSTYFLLGFVSCFRYMTGWLNCPGFTFIPGRV
ncbi:hypothetical protein Ahy_A07g032238 isoform B [Arachis hypogaea]|nr:hypothetical protein Ahy_A07g032238 isoform B [Arachis hypogaea]